MKGTSNSVQPTTNIFSVQNTDVTVDQALAFAAHSSTYQKRTIVILCFTQCCFSFLVMGFPFLFKGPIFTCETELGIEQCEEQDSCNSPDGPSVILQGNSVTEDFGLWCGRKSFIALAGSLLFLGSKGQTLAGFVMPQISAQHGRQWCLLLAGGLAALPLILAASMRSFPVLLVAMFLGGFGQSGFENESYVLLSEISGENFRNFSQVLLSAVWGGSQILFALILRFINDWRIIIALIIGLPLISSLMLIYQFIYESPRYLVAQRMYDNARHVLSKMAKINGRPHFYYRFENEQDQNFSTRQIQRTFKRFLTRQLMIKTKDAGQHDNIDRLQAQAQSYSHLDLFRFRSLRVITLMLLLLWTFRYQTYFGLAFSMFQLGDDIDDNFLFLAISEVLACLISVSVKFRFNRIPSLMIFGLLSASASVALFFPQIPLSCFHLTETCYQKAILMVLAMLVKFSITVFGDILITFTTEVYPTVVRSLGFGLCLSFGKIGSIFIPFLISWFQYHSFNPLIIFGGIGFLAVYGLRYLPETHNQPIQDYIAETVYQEKPFIELAQYE